MFASLAGAKETSEQAVPITIYFARNIPPSRTIKTFTSTVKTFPIREQINIPPTADIMTRTLHMRFAGVGIARVRLYDRI